MSQIKCYLEWIKFRVVTSWDCRKWIMSIWGHFIHLYKMFLNINFFCRHSLIIVQTACFSFLNATLLCYLPFVSDIVYCRNAFKNHMIFLSYSIAPPLVLGRRFLLSPHWEMGPFSLLRHGQNADLARTASTAVCWYFISYNLIEIITIIIIIIKTSCSCTCSHHENVGVLTARWEL